MKTITSLLLALTLLNLSACTTDGKLDQERANRLVDLAIDVAVKSGKISPGDAALVREVGTIVLPKDETTVPAAPVGEVTK